MAHGKKKKGTSVVVWILMILLIAGLGGFGVSNFGGTVNAIGTVGDREITVQRYARALQDQIAAFSSQLGTNLTLSQAQAFGIDRAVLQQLVSTAALENEAAALGLSVGDQEIADQILTIPAFQGIDGKFDREAYRFTLDRSGLKESDFEANLRAEIARTIVQGAVAGGVTPPEVFTETLMNFAGERRDFAFATFGVDQLTSEIASPTEADLRSYFDANNADFMLPETRKITYAWLTPDMLVDTVEVDEQALKDLYQERIAEFVQPERRLVERLILGDAAANAKARLDAGEATFEDLVAERDLALADIDLGDVTKTNLGPAGDAVFAVTEPGVVGPIDTDLGAALFRVNAILAAQETAFEDARPDLIEEAALDRARRVVDDMLENIDDLLAGGATLEELADETELQLGTIDYSVASGDAIAGYQAFRQAAASAAVGDFPEVTQLDDGGIFAMRLDEIIEPRLQEFADAKGQAKSGWVAAETAKALSVQAQAMADQLNAGLDAASLGLTLTAQTGVTRDSFIPDTPDDFLATVFDMAEGEVQVITAETAAYLLRLDGIAPPDADDPDNADRRTQLAEAAAQGIGADMLQAYSNAIQAQVGIELNQTAINAVHTQFP